MKAFGGIAPTYHIELLDKPTLFCDFHSLLLGIQMMFSFMLVDDAKPLKLCKQCRRVFLSNRSNASFVVPGVRISITYTKKAKNPRNDSKKPSQQLMRHTVRASLIYP